MARLNMYIPNYPQQKRTGLRAAIIHNTYGHASAKQEAIRLRSKSQWMNGNAHKFIDDKDIVTVIPMNLVSYNCGDWNRNLTSISYEVCKSRGDKATFLKAENATLKEVAKDLKRYGKNESIVQLHRNIVATACPHRSQAIHGSGAKCLNYFKREVKRYLGSSQPSKPTQIGGIKLEQMLNMDGKVCFSGARYVHGVRPKKGVKTNNRIATLYPKSTAFWKFNGYYSYANYGFVNHNGEPRDYVRFVDKNGKEAWAHVIPADIIYTVEYKKKSQ